MSLKMNPMKTGMNMKIFFCAGSIVDGVIACWTYIEMIMRMTST